jgi:hypothetical protein
MRSRLRAWCVSYLLAASFTALWAPGVFAATYYVRQTVGDDANDGLTPKSAWKHLAKLWNLQPGDTAYIGTGSTRVDCILFEHLRLRLKYW